MGSAHYFLIDDLDVFLTHLEARRYVENDSHSNDWKIYSKTISEVLIKHYGYPTKRANSSTIPIRVTYELLKDGRPLKKLTDQLKALNTRYRKTLPGWKTKRPARPEVRHKRWQDIQRFMHKYSELVNCFKYQADDRLTEGNHSFNLEIASTPKEQTVCLEFIKAIAESYSPEGIIRRRREVDKPRLQRDGWIKRFAEEQKRRGWSSREVAREIQKELREGTWNERSRLQYNLSHNTICKIAGLKIPSLVYHN